MHLVKRFLKDCFHALGFEIQRLPGKNRDNDTLLYQKIIPYASYSPWNGDPLFLDTFSAIRPHTLVDRYRCFSLWKLVEQSAKLPHGAVMEIGVWRGGTGALIATRAKHSGIASPVYLCDTFSGVVKAGAEDPGYSGGEHGDTSRQMVEKLIFSELKLDNVTILEGVFPEETGHIVKDNAFRFCHIDVDVYQSAKQIMEWIWDMMVPGGIIVFDDYGFLGCEGITRFVEEQMALADRLVLYNINGHAVMIKLGEGQTNCI